MSKSIIKQKRILTKAAGGSSLATPVSVANGGTGISSYAIGDIIYASGATTLSKLPIGTASQQLRVNAGATALEYFTPASSGITVGTTTITSGTTLRIPYNLAGVYQEQANFTIGSVATGVLDVPVGLAVGGTQILKKTGSSLFLGTGTPSIGGTIACTFIGQNSGLNAITSTYCTFVGHQAGALTGASIGCVYIGYNNMVVSSPALTGSITMGYEVAATASHQGVLGSNHSSGYISDWYFNGVTHSSAYSVVLNACGGSGTNNAGANLTLAAGKSTGSATPAVINFQSTAAGASSSTAQTLATVLQITNSTTITTSDAVNYALGSTTGTKLGTATTQKIGFWNATPVVQPSGATQAAPAAYATGAFGLDSDANMQALYDLVVAMRTALVNVGIMKGSA